MFINFLLLFLLAGIFGILLFPSFFKKDNHTEHDRENLIRENTELKTKNDLLIAEKSEVLEKFRISEKEKNELSGKGKEMFLNYQNLNNDAKNLRGKISELEKALAKYESEKAAREKEFLEKVEKLEHAREKLHSEQERVKREDEQAQQKAISERDRLWAEHENVVISELKTICQKPEIDFRFFDNENLPEHFHGHFKPDFLVDFLGQFLYFDAKVSRSENLENYLKNQFKSTTEKLKKFGGEIYKNVFFIIPSEAISGIKKRTETIDGFSFFVISPESLEPILATYKMVTKLKNAEKLIASDNEKIVEVLANFEHFIKNQNAANILFAQKAFETLQKKEVLSPQLLEEFSLALKNMKPLKFKDADFKKLSENLADQKSSVQKITAPEVKISKTEIKNAENLFEQIS